MSCWRDALKMGLLFLRIVYTLTSFAQLFISALKNLVACWYYMSRLMKGATGSLSVCWLLIIIPVRVGVQMNRIMIVLCSYGGRQVRWISLLYIQLVCLRRRRPPSLFLDSTFFGPCWTSNEELQWGWTHTKMWFGKCHKW